MKLFAPESLVSSRCARNNCPLAADREKSAEGGAIFALLLRFPLSLPGLSRCGVNFSRDRIREHVSKPEAFGTSWNRTRAHPIKPEYAFVCATRLEPVFHRRGVACHAVHYSCMGFASDSLGSSSSG